MFELSVGQATAVGRVRTSNEDSLLGVPPVFVVADGMGGHHAGGTASSLATSSFSKLAGRRPITPDDVLDAIENARAEICRESALPGRTGMATTVTGVCVVHVDGADRWMIINLGDSRVYHVAGGVMAQVTADHSEVAEMVASGRLSPAEAREHPRRNVVTRYLGAGSVPEVDFWLLPPAQGERFLVCSDGLTAELDDDEIMEVLGATGSAETAAKLLVDAAVTAGGRDNVTVLVIDLLGVVGERGE